MTESYEPEAPAADEPDAPEAPPEAEPTDATVEDYTDTMNVDEEMGSTAT